MNWFWIKITLINILVFTLAMTFANIFPDIRREIWETTIGFYTMEVGFLLGHNRKGGENDKD